jgi:MYXO-CTERM domain-containing protein
LSATATIIVTVGPIVQIAVNPAYPVLESGQTVPFTAKASDSFGNEVTGVAVTWSVDPIAGQIDMQGNFTAGTTEGDFPNAVSATAQGMTGTASVRVGHGGSHADAGVDDGGTGLLPDGGMPGGHEYNAIQTCGCSGGPAGALAMLALLALRMTRRRGSRR